MNNIDVFARQDRFNGLRAWNGGMEVVDGYTSCSVNPNTVPFFKRRLPGTPCRDDNDVIIAPSHCERDLGGVNPCACGGWKEMIRNQRNAQRHMAEIAHAWSMSLVF